MSTKVQSSKKPHGNGHADPGSASLPTRNDLPVEVREQMVGLCNSMLASTFDLQSQTKQAHWNVRGPHFFELHKLFDEFFGVVGEFVDTIAERITALGGVAHGTVRMAAATSRLPEYPVEIHSGAEHVVALADRIAMVGKWAREAIATCEQAGDEGTGDIYVGMVRALDKYLWFVEAHTRA